MIAESLDKAVKAVCPIHGVSVGRDSDRSTWTFSPLSEASISQRQAAVNVLETFVYQPPTQDEIASSALDLSPLEKTIFKQIFKIRKQLDPTLTLAAFRQELITDYKGYL